MSTARSSKSPKSTGASSKNANFSTGFSCPPPAYGITGLNQASSGGSHAIQPSHGLPDTQKRKVTARQSDGKQTEGATPAFHIRPAGDAYEQQADRIAWKITDQLQSGDNINRISEPIKPLRERSGKTEGQAVSPELASNITSAQGKGQPLPAAIRKPAEKALGRTLGDVRLHTGALAGALNRKVGAAAFAVQKDIFMKNPLDLAQPDSQALALHEVMHTQQNRSQTPSIPIQREDGKPPGFFSRVAGMLRTQLDHARELHQAYRSSAAPSGPIPQGVRAEVDEAVRQYPPNEQALFTRGLATTNRRLALNAPGAQLSREHADQYVNDTHSVQQGEMSSTQAFARSADTWSKEGNLPAAGLNAAGAAGAALVEGITSAHKKPEEPISGAPV
ncbi:MAG: DUF4157 domain-containing protein [Lewinellaceae bacterium]|nr:DUF4157 domain-containing protein [Phaeodactylibacter sp.]MCB9037309.1 DUF4157 domain-containing protein [Lewinellaceae bacterium]